MRSSGVTESLWMQLGPLQETARLEGELACDVCVVGAGIAGLTTAYLLAKAGVTVVVLDDGPIAGGETGRTTAHLSSVIDDRFSEIERIHSREAAALAGRSHAAAIDRIEQIVQAEAIDCQFRRLSGYLFLGPDDELDLLRREVDLAHVAGIDAQMLDRLPLDGFDAGPCACFGRQGRFNPLAYLRGLVRCIQRDGGRVFTFSHVSHIEEGPAVRVQTETGAKVRADWLVMATNSPINNLVTIHTKQAAYRTYVIAAPLQGPEVEDALYWDTQDPYHYVRLAEGDGRVYVVVGGEDHKTGQSDNGQHRWRSLEDWARKRWPTMGPIHSRWSGQVMETLDGLAYIGVNPGSEANILVATGDSGMGMTHGTLGGMLLSDLVLHRPNPYHGLYDPSRKVIRAAGRFLKENLNVVAQYSDWVIPGEVATAADIVPDAGAIVRRGLRKVAVYRDAGGKLHEFSATCPHLKCVLAWNPTEHTWDCPCHGSRFSCMGQVVNGPARGNMSPAEPHEDEPGRPPPISP